MELKCNAERIGLAPWSDSVLQKVRNMALSMYIVYIIVCSLKLSSKIVYAKLKRFSAGLALKKRKLIAERNGKLLAAYDLSYSLSLSLCRSSTRSTDWAICQLPSGSVPQTVFSLVRSSRRSVVGHAASARFSLSLSRFESLASSVFIQKTKNCEKINRIIYVCK